MITQLQGNIYVHTANPEGGTVRYNTNTQLYYPPPPEVSDPEKVRGMTAMDESDNRGRLYRLIETAAATGHIQVDFLVGNQWDNKTTLPVYYDITSLPSTIVALAIDNGIFFICYDDSGVFKVQEYYIGRNTLSENNELRSQLTVKKTYTFPTDISVQALTMNNGEFLIVDGSFAIRRFERVGKESELQQTDQRSRIPILPYQTTEVSRITGIVLLEDNRYAITNTLGGVQYYKNIVSTRTVRRTATYKVLADTERGFYRAGVIPDSTERDEEAFDSDFQQLDDRVYSGPIGDTILTTSDGVTRTFELSAQDNDARIVSILKRRKNDKNGTYSDDGQWDLGNVGLAVLALGATITPENISEFHLLWSDGRRIRVYHDEGGTTLRLKRTIYLDRAVPGAKDLVVFGSNIWILDADENKVHAFSEDRRIDRRGDYNYHGILKEDDSFSLHGDNHTPTSLCRGIGYEHWYVGNLDPAGFFVYYAELVRPAIDAYTGATLLSEQPDDAVNPEVFESVITATGDPQPIITSSVTAGSLPKGVTLEGARLSGNPTDITDDTTFTVLYRAWNAAGSDTLSVTYTVEEYIAPVVWSDTATYTFNRPGTSKVDLDLDYNYVTGATSPLTVVGTPPPSWLTFTAGTGDDVGTAELEGTMPYNASTSTIRISGVNKDNNSAFRDFTFSRSGTMYGLDWGWHNRPGTIFAINLDDGTVTAVIPQLSPRLDKAWRSLAHYNGKLWSINTRLNQPNSIDIGTGRIETFAELHHMPRDFEGLVYYNNQFYVVDDDTNGLYTFPKVGGRATLVGTIDVSTVKASIVTEQVVSLAAHGEHLYVIDNRFRVAAQTGAGSSLYRMDPSNAALTLVLDLPKVPFREHNTRMVEGNWRALTSDGTKLYVLENIADAIYEINPTARTISRVTYTRNAPLGWQGLVWVPTRERRRRT